MAAPMKLAIIGAGPSSFYVASRLLSLLPSSHPQGSQLKIHMYDRLWAPHGLVRYGVAPDHPEVKNCVHKFDEAAKDPRLRFFGNVNIGASTPIPHALPVPLQALLPHYTHLLFSTGCTVPILHPALAPSTHCVPALSLVHWYTRHPAHRGPPPLDRTPHVTLIGQGNVSLDIARMLLTPPEVLAQYDVPSSVLDVLRTSVVRHVSIVGRRGPLQAAFTVKELRELTNLPDAAMVPIDPELLAAPSGTKLTRQQTRTLELLRKGSKNTFGTTRKTWSLDFFRAPAGLTGDRLTLAHTSLDANQRAVPTGATSTLDTALVVTALGHRAEPDAPWVDSALGHVRTAGAHVLDERGRTLRNVYASGWAAHGAQGVLATTMMDAYAVADTILRDRLPGEDVETVPVDMDQDPAAGREVVDVLPRHLDGDVDAVPPEVVEGLREHRVTTYEDWKRVDAEEVRRGEAVGKERERMSWEEARRFLRSFT